jgi:hypothetical protein
MCVTPVRDMPCVYTLCLDTPCVLKLYTPPLEVSWNPHDRFARSCVVLTH